MGRAGGHRGDDMDDGDGTLWVPNPGLAVTLGPAKRWRRKASPPVGVDAGAMPSITAPHIRSTIRSPIHPLTQVVESLSLREDALLLAVLEEGWEEGGYKQCHRRRRLVPSSRERKTEGGGRGTIRGAQVANSRIR